MIFCLSEGPTSTELPFLTSLTVKSLLCDGTADMMIEKTNQQLSASVDQSVLKVPRTPTVAVAHITQRYDACTCTSRNKTPFFFKRKKKAVCVRRT